MGRKMRGLVPSVHSVALREGNIILVLQIGKLRPGEARGPPKTPLGIQGGL
jgi:hypothetical protein